MTVLRRVSLGVLLAILYVVAARLGFRLAFVAEQITTVWPPTGLAVAGLLVGGLWLWPGVWVGAFIANASTAVPIWVAAGIATGNTLEAAVAALLLARVLRIDYAFRTIRSVVAFVLIAVLLAPLISATTGVLLLCAGGVQPWARFGQLWSDWWLGDALGALVVAPALLGLACLPPGWTWRRFVEGAVLIAATAFVTDVVFQRLPAGTTSGHPLEFVIFPLVILAAVRLQPPATPLVVLTASAVALWGTVHGTGPFADADPHRSLVLLQTFMGIIAGTGLLLGAAIAEQRTGERRRAAAYRVGETLGQAPDLTQAAPELLRHMCGMLHWSFGSLWTVDVAAGRLRCLATWASTPAVASFADASTALALARGTDVPGRVWASGRETWVEDPRREPGLPRAGAARAAGLRSAFGFPIYVREEIVGVIECFSAHVVLPDADLLRTMASIAYQIGQFIGRVDAEREREELLQGELDARRAAESANRAKDEFLATLSHELRTPLNAIAGWTQLLIDGSLDAAQSKKALTVIDRNAQLQTQLVADILDVSRIITGGLRLNVRAVDLRAIVMAAIDVVRPAASAKNVRLTSEIALPPEPHQGDPQRLQQIVWNLLTNAVKFTPSGGHVHVSLFERGDRTTCIRVQDTGAGIDSATIAHVFERFWQADSSKTRRHGGLGLGLAIVRHLVELHGGTVRAESAGPGMGSTFVVELPPLLHEPREAVSFRTAAAVPADQERAQSQRRLDGCRAVVVDDEEDAREMTATILRAAGASVETAATAREALGLLRRSHVDVLLADLGMPGEDGYDLVRAVRAGPMPDHRVAVVALTAYAGADDRARAFAAGFDRYLVKPVASHEVIDAAYLLWRGPSDDVTSVVG